MSFSDRFQQIAVIGAGLSPIAGGVLVGSLAGGPVGAVVGGLLGLAALATVISALGSTFGPAPQKPYERAIVNAFGLLVSAPSRIKAGIGSVFNKKAVAAPPATQAESKPAPQAPQPPAA